MLLQCLKQAQWPDENAILTLPGITKSHKYVGLFYSLQSLFSVPTENLDRNLPREVYFLCTFSNRQFFNVLAAIPRLDVRAARTERGTLLIQVKRLNPGYTDRNLVYAPRFPKPQQESWFVLAADEAEEKVLALQRVTMPKIASVELEIPSEGSQNQSS